MTVPARIQAFPPGLFVPSAEEEELKRVRAAREEIGAAIRRLKPRSHRCVELMVRMRALTERQLRLEMELGRRS